MVLHTFFLRCAPSDFAAIYPAFGTGVIAASITKVLQAKGYPQPNVKPPKTFCGSGASPGAGGGCLACPVGSFKTLADNSSCLACPPLASTPQARSVVLSQCGCNGGYHSGLGQYNTEAYGVAVALKQDFNCHECSAGTYCEEFMAQRMCPLHAWSGNRSSARSDCACQAGYSGANGEVCSPCAAGTYRGVDGSVDSLTGPVVCSACPSGTNSSLASTGVGDCSCIAGHTAESDGMACAACETGKYKTSTGTGACSVCPLGTSSSARSGELTDCKCIAGYTAGSDGAECTACGAGTFKSSTGTGSCSACPAGTSSGNATGRDEATDCICGAGYTAGADGLECTACGAGTYKFQIGVGPCVACGVDSYSPSFGAVSPDTCLACPASSSSPSASASASACTCDPGTYGVAGELCLACPAGSYCPGGTRTVPHKLSVSRNQRRRFLIYLFFTGYHWIVVCSCLALRKRDLRQTTLIGTSIQREMIKPYCRPKTARMPS